MTRRAFALLAVAALVPLLSSPARGHGPTVKLSSPFRVEVTGAPAPVRTLRLGIETAAHIAFPELEDAEIVLVATQPPLRPLPAGQSVTIEAHLAITTPEGSPLVWVVPVTVTNTPAAWPDAQRLFVSDSPEIVSREGILYTETLDAFQTARILYHHQNGRGDRPLWLLVILSNPTPSPARLWVVGATGGPHRDELLVGHTAARGFLEQYGARAGVFLEVPPYGTLPLMATRVLPQEVASGLAQIALLRGVHVDVQLAAQFPQKDEPPIVSRILPVDTQHQRGAFAAPLITRTLSYTAHGPVAAMWVGADADLLHDQASGAPLQGNYGVIYTFEVQLTNPTPEPFTAALAMHANGGPAGATLLINGALIDVPAVQPDTPRTVTRVQVPATAGTRLHISTVSEGGANYPVLFTLGLP